MIICIEKLCSCGLDKANFNHIFLIHIEPELCSNKGYLSLMRRILNSM